MIAHPLEAGRRLEVARVGAHAALTLVLAAAIGMASLLALGFRVLIVRSGSMEPAIMTGDLIVTDIVRPSDVGVGEVVTFSDATRNGDLVTHRVVKKERTSAGYRFLTQGDANTGTEDWTTAADGQIGSYRIRIPRAGYALAWLGTPRARGLMTLAGVVLLGVTVLRRIWRR